MSYAHLSRPPGLQVEFGPHGSPCLSSRLQMDTNTISESRHLGFGCLPFCAPSSLTSGASSTLADLRCGGYPAALKAESSLCWLQTEGVHDQGAFADVGTDCKAPAAPALGSQELGCGHWQVQNDPCKTCGGEGRESCPLRH